MADDDLVVTRDVVVPAAALDWRFSRSGGPGGQGVNTADSRVELSLDVTTCPGVPERQRDRLRQRLASRLHDGVLTVVASEHRSQLRNRQAARERLAATLRDALAPDPPRRRPTRPGRGAVERRLASKHRAGDRKRLRRPPEGE